MYSRYITCMKQVSPSAPACAELLRALPGITALRKSLGRLTPPETAVWLPVLSVIVRHPDGLRMGALADELRVDQSVASRQFARIEAAGLGYRSPDPSDGRAQILRASDAGRDWMAEAIDAYSSPMADMLPGWSDDDVGQLTRMLHRLSETLALAPAPAAPLQLDSPITDAQKVSS